MGWNVPGCTRMYQDAPGCTRVYQGVPGCTRIYQDVPECYMILNRILLRNRVLFAKMDKLYCLCNVLLLHTAKIWPTFVAYWVSLKKWNFNYCYFVFTIISVLKMKEEIVKNDISQMHYIIKFHRNFEFSFYHLWNANAT